VKKKHLLEDLVFMNATLKKRVLELETIAEGKGSEIENQKQLLENEKQTTATLQKRVLELETIMEGMNAETEKQKQKLEVMEHINAVLRAKNNLLTEEISSLHVDINVTQDQNEKELLVKVWI
jgi:hypothetical protein